MISARKTGKDKTHITMVVTIELFGIHRVHAKTGSITMPITEETAVGDALEYVRNRYPGLHLEEHSIVITVNREVVSLDRLLKPKDIVRLLPHIGGG
jgi:molybdopterin converting factor small subunit